MTSPKGTERKGILERNADKGIKDYRGGKTPMWKRRTLLPNESRFV